MENENVSSKECEFDDGSANADGSRIVCHNKAEYRTGCFYPNFNLCEKHAKIYSHPMNELRRIQE